MALAQPTLISCSAFSAFDLWRELERLSGTALLEQTGGLMIGAPGSELVEGARHGARTTVRRFVPAADDRVLASVVCLYTNTPDGYFWIDRHPERSNVLVASPCSGHGFKFAPVIGEIVAALVGGRKARVDLGLFR